MPPAQLNKVAPQGYSLGYGLVLPPAQLNTVAGFRVHRRRMLRALGVSLPAFRVSWKGLYLGFEFLFEVRGFELLNFGYGLAVLGLDFWTEG